MNDEKRRSRNRILEMIAALKAKTTENGCTEEEAMAAAEKIAELMDKYDLDGSDVEMGAAECERRDGNTKKDEPALWVADDIGYFTDTMTWCSKNVGGETVVFFGLPHDVENAHYFFDLIKQAMARAGQRYYLKELCLFRSAHRAKMLDAFYVGMASRIGNRLRQMKDERNRKTKLETGRDLVVVKSAIVKRDFDALGLKIRKSRSSRQILDAQAYASGRAAGDGVALNAGVGATGAASAIGRR